MVALHNYLHNKNTVTPVLTVAASTSYFDTLWWHIALTKFHLYFRLKDFISKKADRERELQEKKRQKFKMLEESPRHTFQDEAYFQQRELREKNLYDSLDKGKSG